MARSSIMVAAPLSLLHFALGGKDTVCTPVAFLSHYLEKFHPTGGFIYVKIQFDVTSYDKIDEYKCAQDERIELLTRHLGSHGRVVVFFFRSLGTRQRVALCREGAERRWSRAVYCNGGLAGIDYSFFSLFRNFQGCTHLFPCLRFRNGV
ncbi:hypothetical protein K503DRAFT_772461, partial [Rhizopogon vinicolor AM-OR11-026]